MDADARLAKPVGYYCDHSDEPYNARTHYDWEWTEEHGFVFMHKPDTISSHGGMDQRYLAEAKRGIRCSRAEALYPARIVTGLIAETAELRAQLAIRDDQVTDLDTRLAEAQHSLDASTSDEQAGAPA